jgi:hypothetical protein
MNRVLGLDIQIDIKKMSEARTVVKTENGNATLKMDRKYALSTIQKYQHLIDAGELVTDELKKGE